MVTIFIKYIIIPAARRVARKGWEEVEALISHLETGVMILPPLGLWRLHEVRRVRFWAPREHSVIPKTLGP